MRLFILIEIIRLKAKKWYKLKWYKLKNKQDSIEGVGNE